jgi:hypothetical protein
VLRLLKFLLQKGRLEQERLERLEQRERGRLPHRL